MNRVRIGIACLVVVFFCFLGMNSSNEECTLEKVEVDSICQYRSFSYPCKKPGYRLAYDDKHGLASVYDFKDIPPPG